MIIIQKWNGGIFSFNIKEIIKIIIIIVLIFNNKEVKDKSIREEVSIWIKK